MILRETRKQVNSNKKIVYTRVCVYSSMVVLLLLLAAGM